ncbi:MAG: FAD-binding domain-containing protein [Thermoflexales bacterium]
MIEIRVTGQTREERARSLAQQLEGLYSGEPTPSSWRGGRSEGLRRLATFDVRRYADGRNYTQGSTVSQLSPYIRHGALTLAEVRDVVVRQHPRSGVEKFVNELAWRAFWRSVYAAKGTAIGRNIELPKYTRPVRWSATLPDDVAQAQTGLACIDDGLHELFTLGYVHNHWRMWFAAYLLHWRRVDWQVGARLFEQHLLDGDPASNRLSWQWVAGTFSHKPYYFNRANVERYSRGTHCVRCSAAAACPFEGSYEVIAQRLGLPQA